MHSIVGLSGAARYIACPGSVRVGWNAERTSSIYAKRGTMCHWIIEQCLLYPAKKPMNYVGTTIRIEDEDFIVEPKDIEGCQLFLDVVHHDLASTPGAKLFSETWINMDWVHEPDFACFGPLPDGFTLEFGGTADVRIQQYLGLLRVYDYKNGSGKIVEVEHNPQLMGYGLGALGENNINMFEEVELIIVQPHAPHKNGYVRRWRTTPEELYEWKDTVLVPALKAAEQPDALLCENKGCWFCPGKDNCPLQDLKRWEKTTKLFMEAVK